MSVASDRRILQVFNRYLFRGGEEAVFERFGHLLPEIAEVDSCLFDSAEWKGESAPPIWKQPFLMWENPEAIQRLKEKHAAFQPDVWILHNIFPVGSAAVYRTALELDVPIIQICHNFRPFSVNGNCWARDRLAPESIHLDFKREILAGAWQGSRLKTAIYASVLWRLHRSGWLNSVKRWIAISDFVRDKFIDAGIPPERVTTLLHSWDIVNPHKPGFSHNGSFLYLGRLSVEKGVHVLLEAWRIMGKDAPPLNLCGEGPLENSVIEAQEKENLNIRRMGIVTGEEKTSLFNNCLALIAPSTCWEALGLVVYEAYDYGKPVLAARSGGLQETVQHQITGLLHEPGNARELAQQVLSLTQNPTPAESWGTTGRTWLEQNTRPSNWLSHFATTVDEVVHEE